jgi:hypothetical protein
LKRCEEGGDSDVGWYVAVGSRYCEIDPRKFREKIGGGVELKIVGVTGVGTLMYGCNRVGTPVCGEVSDMFSCMKTLRTTHDVL